MNEIVARDNFVVDITCAGQVIPIVEAIPEWMADRKKKCGVSGLAVGRMVSLIPGRREPEGGRG